MREGWKSVCLSDVCTFKPPKKEVRQRLNPDDAVSFVPMNNLKVRMKSLELNEERALGKVAGSYTYFADGDVLLAKITPCFENGKLGIANGLTNGVGFGSSEFIVMRPKDELDAEYLFYFLSQDSVRDAGARVMSGAVGHKRVPKEFVEGLQLPLPAVTEQKRIVAILDEAFEGIDTVVANTEKNLANARKLFASYLHAMFSKAYLSGNIVALSELASDITDGDHMPPPKSETGIPFITIKNIDKQTREVDFDNAFRVPAEYFDALKYNRKPKKGDILYTVTGSYGIPVVVDHDKSFCFQRHIGLVRPKDFMDSRWVCYLLMSPQVVSQANEQAAGTAQKTVSLKKLRGFNVPQIPLEVQLHDVNVLDDISAETSRLELIYQQKLTALAELKQSLLQKAFSGELTAERAEAAVEEATA